MKREGVEQPSRRWVLQLGAGVLLTGFSGVEADTPELPPGLFLPSTDHLAHALRQANAKPLAGYAQQFFSLAEYRLLGRVIGAFLGAVPNAANLIADITNWIDLTVYDSSAVRAAAQALAPAHRVLAVQFYGANEVRELETFDPQSTCRDGLRALAALPGIHTDAGLLTALRDAGETRKDKARHDAVTRFYEYIKRRAIEGYYTSKEGLKELDYKGNSFYAESPGCDNPSHASP